MAKLSKLVGLSGLLVAAACGGGKKANTTVGNSSSADASIAKVDPTLCETSGKNVVTYDLNHDNRPDVWRLYKVEDEGGTKIEFMTCKQVDFDHDGRKDWVVAYTRKGNPEYERADFDYDGKWDMSAVYDKKTATLIEVERDTNFDGKFDVREAYDSAGTLTSVRRDRNNDGEPDLWEQYKDTVLLSILYDDDFDGKVDRRDEVPGSRPKMDVPPPPVDTTETPSDNAGTTGTDTGAGGTGTGATGTGAGGGTAPKK